MNEQDVVRNARLEAQRVVGDAFEARVLEPSPPPVVDGPWFADDPVAVDDASPGRPVVSPVAHADLTWDEWVRGKPERSDWAADRWLGAYRRIGSPPTAYTETRTALHRVAVYAVSPARRRANGKIGLRFTLRGFGTPFFETERGAEQVRVSGADLIRQTGDTGQREPLTTLGLAAALALDGPPDVAWAEGFDVPAPGDPDEPLSIDSRSAHFLGEWFGFAWSVLEAVRTGPASVEPARLQLWPEHFDAAFDCQSPGRHRQATFGASPGDAAVEEPYLYVLPADFDDLVPSDLWNADGFHGAIAPLSTFVDAPDQREAALAFFGQRQTLLDAPEAL